MKGSSSFFTAVLFATVQAALASNVVDLDPKNFDKIVLSGKPALVEFFAVSVIPIKLSPMDCC